MIWYIALGSALGGVTRYALGGWVQRLAGTPFPVGTLVVNGSGSFLLGLLLRYALETPAISPEVRALLTIGFCGGYTTFSTFSYETLTLLEDAEYLRAGWYVGASIVVSLVGVFAGSVLARELLALRRGA
jgi:CrcB protein